MLYDNAQLASLYLHAWLATGDPTYRRVTEETLDYLLAEMRHPSGGFFSAQDADSEGVEGKFFVWSPDEIRSVLGDDAMAEAVLRYWGVSDGPNFEGQSILFVPRAPDDVAAELGISADRLSELVARARQRLYAARDKRVHPGLDDKVLASWNGLALSAFAEAGRALGRPDYIAAAVDNGRFLTTSMMDGGRLMRSWKDGRARIKGYLEDYAMVGAGLVSLYEATFDRRWLDESRRLAEAALGLFWDAERGAFFDTGADHEALIVRPRNIFDNAVPSGASVAIDWLLRLALVLGEERYEARALEALRPMADLMTRYPSGFGRYLSALDFHLGPVAEVAVVWPAGGEAAAQPLLHELFGRYLPNRVVAGRGRGRGDRRPAAARRARGNGRPGHRVRLPPLCLPDAGDDAGGARAPARGCILRIADAGGGFLRTGCGPGPLEPALGNSSEGNAPRRRAIGAAPTRGAVFLWSSPSTASRWSCPRGSRSRTCWSASRCRASSPRWRSIARSRPRRPTRRPRSAKVTRSRSSARWAAADREDHIMYDTSLWLGGKEYRSRLIVGTGKYPSFENMREAIEASGAEIVTVAVRRVNLPGQGESLLDYIDTNRYTLLPNTAGCYTADEAVRTCYLAREAGLGNLVKLEVIGDSRTLFPDTIGLLEATRTLAREGFSVLPYANDDPVLAKRLEDAGAAAVMPLGAPIGSGLGIRNPYNIKLVLEAVSIPVIVDAGVGTASDSAIAMELGCDGVLMNTAIAGAKDPVAMATAMKLAVEAGRLAFKAGRIGKKLYATASSPLEGVPEWTS